MGISLTRCYYCNARPGVKTDGKSRFICERCAAGTPPPLRRPAENRTGRNQPCPCGSGKKFKRCCVRVFLRSESYVRANA